jgi:A/G-specific adenine glycosylase
VTSPQHALLNWYKKNGRNDLPWRTTRDPYAIYISEIMLQQTQVKTVLTRYYHPFLARFPNLISVSEAPIDAILKAWEGLGYYTRARHLHQCAQQCVHQFGGTLPTTWQELEQLPGIGRSTARAISCFAFGESVSILDANVKRILYRYHAQQHLTVPMLWKLADSFLNHDQAYEHNQAMMDLGALICTSKAPRCPDCPLRCSCRGTAQALDYPKARKKKPIPVRQRHIVVYQHEQHLGIITNPDKFLGGLMSFPQHTHAPKQGRYLGKLQQRYSHFTLVAKVWLVQQPCTTCQWVARDAFDALALSCVDRKVVELVDQFDM